MTQQTRIRSIPSPRPTDSVEPVAGVEAHAEEPAAVLRSQVVGAMDELVLRRGWDVELARVLVTDQVARGFVHPSTTGQQLADQVETWCEPIGWAAGVSRGYLGREHDVPRGPIKAMRVSRRMPT